MITKTIEFEVRPQKQKKVIQAIEAFARSVHVSEPGSRLYLSIQDKSNPNKFMHVMVFENEGAELKHRSAGYTKEFVSLLEKSCKHEPVAKDYAYIGGL